MGTTDYLMENPEEEIRLEIKTDPRAVREEACWCGLKPGMRVMDAGCGPGMITSILYDMIQPGGSITGVDYSEERIKYAKQHYADDSGIDFRVHDLRSPIEDLGMFDLVWVRFVLEYNLRESTDIVRNLTHCLKPGGCLCLLDLDHNCLNHYELPVRMEEALFKLMKRMEQEFNFDPYSGRKLYSYLYDMGYEHITLDLVPHHLIYGKVKDSDAFNWLKKTQIAAIKAQDIFENYPGGSKAFFADFVHFFNDPRRFTYTSLLLCKGTKPLLSP
ncbi:MAG: methyltransferase domain-containing protein [Deltaproteobacteria bacterium]|nr:methyltransferase domain-containing protein [Deltaproteobacteria bacterium]